MRVLATVTTELTMQIEVEAESYREGVKRINVALQVKAEEGQIIRAEVGPLVYHDMSCEQVPTDGYAEFVSAFVNAFVLRDDCTEALPYTIPVTHHQ